MSLLTDFIEIVVRVLYLGAVVGLAVYGLLGFYTVVLFWRTRAHLPFRHAGLDQPPAPEVWPSVTVQLPIYNERYVVQRLISSVARLDYPADRLEIQVIDDSTDDTTALASALIAAHVGTGLNIQHIRRDDRVGFKAGALSAAMCRASGEYMAIFDADFQPAPDFLRLTIPHLIADPGLGIVQARWGHLNAAESLLTRAQAMALDKHFAVEQSVRSRAGLFPKFNGTAGVLRRECLLDAGGWQDDTVCEDLCLSTRAVMRGWRMRFLPQVVAPAELPDTVSALKCQQRRWATGSTQCLLKFAPAIRRSPNRLTARLYALLTMSSYSTSLLLILLLLLQLPMLTMDVSLPRWLVALGLAGIGQPVLFLLGQGLLYRDWPRRLLQLPALLLVAVGMSVTISGGVLQGVFGKDRSFSRTPKAGLSDTNKGRARAYQAPVESGMVLELFLAAYAGVGIRLALHTGDSGSLVFLVSCLLGFGYIGCKSLLEYLQQFRLSHRALKQV